MSFRTVLVKNKAKLSYKNDFLIVQGEETKMVHLSEINTLLIESTMTQISSYLISELVRNKIKVIFCDEKHNPCCEVMPYYNSFNTAKKIISQVNWKPEFVKTVWTHIVAHKIKNQVALLQELGFKNAEKLQGYLEELEFGDESNREGHSAKVYFNTLFGKSFCRDEICEVNKALDYGYTILLSAFNRAISNLGYINPLGINHKNEYNNFNLGCDLMEPFRILVDRIVYAKKDDTFDDEYKKILIDILNSTVKYQNKNIVLINAIPVYIVSIVKAIETGNMNELKIYEYEL